MANIIADTVLDNGLAYLNAHVDKIYLCSTAPTTYTEATSTYALANASATFGSPAAGSPNGRKVTSSSISGGSVTGTGTAVGWAAVYTGSTLLLANGALSASQAVTSGNTFSLAAFDIRFPNQ
jgi:hypothetical protein